MQVERLLLRFEALDLSVPERELREIFGRVRRKIQADFDAESTQAAFTTAWRRQDIRAQQAARLRIHVRDADEVENALEPELRPSNRGDADDDDHYPGNTS